MADHWFKIAGCGGVANCEKTFNWFKDELAGGCGNPNESVEKKAAYNTCLETRMQSDTAIDETGAATAFHEHDLRRLKATLKWGLPWEATSTKYRKLSCGGNAECEQAFDQIVSDLPNYCKVIDDDIWKKACTESDFCQGYSQDSAERDDCISERIKDLRKTLKLDPAKAVRIYDMPFHAWYRIVDGFGKADLEPMEQYLDLPKDRIEKLAKEFNVELKPAAKSEAASRPTQAPVAVADNLVWVYLGVGASFMPLPLGTIPIGCADGTTACWTGTGSLPDNGVGNPTAVQPVGAAVALGLDYSRRIYGPFRFVVGAEGSYAHLFTSSTGGPNTEPAALNEISVGGRVGVGVNLRRVMIDAAFTPDYSSWWLSGGSWEISVPYSIVGNDRFAQGQLRLGGALRVFFPVNNKIAVGVAAKCSVPVTDGSPAIQRFDNPAVAPDHITLPLLCNAVVEGAYNIASF